MTSNISIETINKAIVLLSNNDSALENKEVIKLFIDNNIKKDEAIELSLFLPIAFCRLLLPRFEWHDSYLEYIGKDKQTEKKFSDTQSFVDIFNVTNEYFKNNPNSKMILKIAGRSSEFKAINQLLIKGEKIEDIKLTKTLIIR